MRRVLEIVRAQDPGLEIGGEMQVRYGAQRGRARTHLPGLGLTGQANVFVCHERGCVEHCL